MRKGDERVQFHRLDDGDFYAGVEVPGRALGVVTRARRTIRRSEYKDGRPREYWEEIPESHWIAYVEEEVEPVHGVVEP